MRARIGALARTSPTSPTSSCSTIRWCRRATTSRAWIEQARSSGCRTIRTGALFPSSVDPFVDAGFDTIDRLALLETRLRPVTRTEARREQRSAHVPTPSGRRIRATRPAARVISTPPPTIDRRAFPAPWGNDRAALADILRRHARVPRPRDRHRIARCRDSPSPVWPTASDTSSDSPSIRPRSATDSADALVADSLAWMRRRNATRAMVNTAFDNAAALALVRVVRVRTTRRVAPDPRTPGSTLRCDGARDGTAATDRSARPPTPLTHRSLPLRRLSSSLGPGSFDRRTRAHRERTSRHGAAQPGPAPGGHTRHRADRRASTASARTSRCTSCTASPATSTGSR